MAVMVIYLVRGLIQFIEARKYMYLDVITGRLGNSIL